MPCGCRVWAWAASDASIAAQHGEIEDWDVTNVTDFSQLFSGLITFKREHQRLEQRSSHRHELRVPCCQCVRPANRFVGHVERHRHEPDVFWGRCLQPARRSVGHIQRHRHEQEFLQEATVFNQPIGSWNTSNVIDMTGMFSSALACSTTRLRLTSPSGGGTPRASPTCAGCLMQQWRPTSPSERGIRRASTTCLACSWTLRPSTSLYRVLGYSERHRHALYVLGRSGLQPIPRLLERDEHDLDGRHVPGCHQLSSATLPRGDR